MGGRKPLKRKGGSSPTFPTQATKMARQRSAPPSPLPPESTDSDNLSTHSELSDSTCTSTGSSQKSTQSILSTQKAPTSVPSDQTTSPLSNSSIPSPKPTNSRPPPLILSSNSWRKIAPTIYKLPNFIPSNVTAKASANGQITIHTTDSSHFRQIQKTLLANQTPFHTFALPEERSLKVVLKGIPIDIPVDEVKAELESLNFSVTFVRRFGTPDRPMPMCVVHITSNSSSKEIFSLTNLFYIQISVEPLKPSGPAQCFSCQRFGHGSRNCGHPPRCVKCAGNHVASNCSKPREQTPTCCNCGGPHTANFRGCPTFLELKPVNPAQTPLPPQSKFQTTAQHKPTVQLKPRQSNPVSTPPHPSPSPNTPSTYASATAGPVASPIPQHNLSMILNLLTNILTALTNNQDPKALLETTIKTFLTLLSPQNE